MADEYSATLVLQDQATPTLSRISEASRAASKELSQLESRLTSINRKKTKLTVDTQQACRDLQAAQKELRATEKAVSDTAESTGSLEKAQDRLRKAQFRYDELRSEYAKLGNEAKHTQANINALFREIRNAPSISTPGSDSDSSGMTLGKVSPMQGVQQLAQQLGASLSQGIDYYVGSALGSRKAGYISSTLSSAFTGGTTGAMIGSAIAPGIGTAIGAAGGALLGAISGGVSSAIQNAETKDDYFRSAVSELYETISAQFTEKLTSGISTAASRETIGVSFATLLGGKEHADALLAEINTFANATPYNYDELAGVARIIVSSGYGQDDIMTVLQAAGEASSAVGGGAAGMQTIATVLGRINSGQLGAEELGTLTNIGINGYELMAARISRETGSTVDQQWVRNALSEGYFTDNAGTYGTAQEFAAALIEELLGVYEGSLEAQSQTTEGLQSTLSGMQTSLDAAMGAGYNDERKRGLQEEISFMESHQAGLEDVYARIGQYEASLVNQQEALLRDVQASALRGELTGSALELGEESQQLLLSLIDEFQAARDSGDNAALDTAWKSIVALGESEYTNTEAFEEQRQEQLNFVKNLQAEVSQSWYDAGLAFADEMSKGIVAGLDQFELLIDPILAGMLERSEAYWAERNPPGAEITGAKAEMVAGVIADLNSHASGLNRVPYNNYAALLHEDERVLTAREARNYREGSKPTVHINVTGNTIQSPADEDRLAAKIANMMREALLLAPA